MPDQPAWLETYEAERRRGIAARAQGKEGMARVCARRAAGALVRAHFDRTGAAASGLNVLNLLRMLGADRAATTEVRELAGYFILQITEEHVLPGDIDLLDAVERLREALFPAG